MSYDALITFMFFAVILSAVTFISGEKLLEHIKGRNLKSVMYSIKLIVLLLWFGATIYLCMKTIVMFY